MSDQLLALRFLVEDLILQGASSAKDAIKFVDGMEARVSARTSRFRKTMVDSATDAEAVDLAEKHAASVAGAAGDVFASLRRQISDAKS